MSRPESLPAHRLLADVGARLEDLNDSQIDLHKQILSIREMLYDVTSIFCGNEPKVINKPWGNEKIIELNNRYSVKLINMNSEQEMSLHYHLNRHETIFCLSGTGSILLGEEVLSLEMGAYMVVPPPTVHKIRSTDDLVLIECGTAHMNDIVRLKDSHGRCTELPSS